jgi:GNAT superfamily N-acetyltransferase
MTVTDPICQGQDEENGSVPGFHEVGRSQFEPPGLKPGRYQWQSQGEHPMMLRLLFLPNELLQVDLWWGPSQGAANVTLAFGLYNHSVEFGELLGNGFDDPEHHRKGFGTLAVNTAIQAIQAIYLPHARIEGILSNVAEQTLPAEEQARLTSNRREFWRRFGLNVIEGDEGIDELHGLVSGLKCVRHGLIAGELPRLVPLQAFQWVSARA